MIIGDFIYFFDLKFYFVLFCLFLVINDLRIKILSLFWVLFCSLRVCLEEVVVKVGEDWYFWLEWSFKNK